MQNTDPTHKKHKRPVSVLVLIYTPQLDTLLLERADYPGAWQSVTGSLEADESPLEAAQRELFEETGFDIDSPRDALGAIPQRVPFPDAAAHGVLQHPDTRDVSCCTLHDWCLVNRWEIWPRWRYRYAPGVTENSEHVFALEVPERFTPTLSPREHLAWVWHDWYAAAERVFSPSNAQALRLLPQRIRG